MRGNAHQITPLGAVVRGALAGGVGTGVMDLVWFSRYKKGGGEQGFIAWETAEGVEKWDQASAPGLVGKRLAEGFLQREVPDRWARVTTNVVHWATGVAWGAQYGIAAGSKRRGQAVLALSLGPAVWLASYVVLPLAKLYKPIWEYDAKTLAKDLSAHVAYGAATGAAFSALAR